MQLQLRLLKPTWWSHFVLGIMLMFMLIAHWLHLSRLTQKKFITPKLSPLCMLTKTRFDRLAIGDWIFNFPITKLDDQTFWSSTFNHHNRRLKISNCQLSGIKVGNQIFFNLPQKKFRSCPKFLVLQLIVASNPLTRFLLSLLKFFWALLEKFDH